MKNFSKPLTYKIISIIAAGVLFFNAAVYGIELSNKTHLRKELDFNNSDSNTISRYFWASLSAAYQKILKNKTNISPQQFLESLRKDPELSKFIEDEDLQVIEDVHGNAWIHHAETNTYAIYKDGLFWPKEESEFRRIQNRDKGVIETEEYLAHEWENKASNLNKIKQLLDNLIEKIIDEYSIVVISPHDNQKIPIDGDSFTFSAAVYRRLVHEAGGKGRDVEFITDPNDARHDGKLYICLLPLSHYKEDERMIDFSELKGKRALFVGDVFLPEPDRYKRGSLSDSFGFDTIIVQDHHKWSKEFIAANNIGTFNNCIDKYERDKIFLINVHLIIGEVADPDSYASGAFEADLMKTEGDPWYHFLKQLSLYADYSSSNFPSLNKDLDSEEARHVSGLLNLCGTYLFNWKPEELAKRRGAMKEIIQVISSSGSFEDLRRGLEETMQRRFGDDFFEWSRGIMNEVDGSIKEFLASNRKVYFYKIPAEKGNVTLLVHKIVFGLLNDNGQFGNRVLVHYYIAEDNSMAVLLARRSDFDEIDVSFLCINGPKGRWGGGHAYRAGFGLNLFEFSPADFAGFDLDLSELPQEVLNDIGLSPSELPLMQELVAKEEVTPMLIAAMVLAFVQKDIELQYDKHASSLIEATPVLFNGASLFEGNILADEAGLEKIRHGISNISPHEVPVIIVYFKTQEDEIRKRIEIPERTVFIIADNVQGDTREEYIAIIERYGAAMPHDALDDFDLVRKHLYAK